MGSKLRRTATTVRCPRIMLRRKRGHSLVSALTIGCVWCVCNGECAMVIWCAELARKRYTAIQHIAGPRYSGTSHNIYKVEFENNIAIYDDNDKAVI
jgi:hypothetical protein